MKNVLKFSTLPELSSSLAAELSLLITRFSREKEKLTIALSGGNTPNSLFKELAEHYSTKIKWSGVHLYWVDERCVPPDDPDSNYGMAKKSLLNHLSIPPGNINRIRGEEEPAGEAKRYSGLVLNNVEQKNNLPSFNITLLGIGEDGHTASIFPDQMHLLDSPEIYSHSIHPSTKQSRITMTGKVINNSEYIFILVSGKNKAKIVSAVLNKETEALAYPANYIEPASNKLYWYLDSEASEGL